MGAFSRRDNIILPDPSDAKAAAEFRKLWGWEPHEYAEIRGKFTQGIQRKVSNVSTSLDQNGKVASAMGDGGHIMLQEMIVSWTFTDDNGNVLPIDAASLEELPSDYGLPILAIIQKLQKGKGAEEQKAFLPSVNGHLKESSTEMSVYPTQS